MRCEAKSIATLPSLKFSFFIVDYWMGVENVENEFSTSSRFEVQKSLSVQVGKPRKNSNPKTNNTQTNSSRQMKLMFISLSEID